MCERTNQEHFELNSTFSFPDYFPNTHNIRISKSYNIRINKIYVTAVNVI